MLIIKDAEKKPGQEKKSVEDAVRAILQNVKDNGDKAILDYTEKFDGFRPTCLSVSKEEIKAAYGKVTPETVENLKFSAERIRNFAEHQMSCLKELRYEITPGVFLGHRIIPIESCGCYVPAGRYPLPSSALMSVIPAKVAGVSRIAACSPASRGFGGIHPSVLVAMDIAGADEVYCMGGAQAIGAYAFGTQTIKPVDIIVGPGNQYVTEAKRQISGRVGIDMLAGPSEVVIMADGTANPEWVAADALARCEHDPNSWTVIVTTSRDIIPGILDFIEKEAKMLPTAGVAMTSWKNNSKIILADDVDEAVAITNDIAPEHLQVMMESSSEVAKKLRNFGSLFVGYYAPVAFGDYVSGTNHILPTSRCSRFSNGVCVGTFLKMCSVQEITKEGAQMLAPHCAYFAGVEGLFGHQHSAELRK